MKIKNISCTQFAGVRDHEIAFNDGINVLYGKNESGKSTTVNLISRTLFQGAKIRKGSDFSKLYFPTARKGSSIVGDFADGKLVFETENGTYTLSKEWGSKEARCLLSTPDGVIRDQEQIDEILKEVLLYGEGVYSDFLLSSQRNTDDALKTLLDSTKKTDSKADITNAVSQAFVESDGIPIAEIEQKIADNVKALVGDHWDVEADRPKDNKGKRWKSSLGEVLSAYYDALDAKLILNKITELENEADRTSSEFTDREKEFIAAENNYKQFEKCANAIQLLNSHKKEAVRLENDIKKAKQALGEWPKLAKNLEKAKALKAESENRATLDKYETAKAITAKINELSAEANAHCPTADEQKQVREMPTRISRLENKLCGMNLTAAVQMLGGNTVEITSVRTGEKIDISGGAASIGEAVKITVPGVMEMQLSPADVDVAAIEKEISDGKRLIEGIYQKYAVEDSDALTELVKKITAARANLENENGRLSALLGETKFEDLETAANTLPTDIRTKDEIYNDIAQLCDGEAIDGFIAAKKTKIDGYKSEYGSENELNSTVAELAHKLEKENAAIAEAEDIPEEFANIDNPEYALQKLQNDMESKDKLRENALLAKTSAAQALESYQSNLEHDPKDDFEEKGRVYGEKKKLLKHWLHIQKVFAEQKENLNANPMQDIAESFTRYLGLISNGRVSSEFPETDKLEMQVYSDDRPIDYDKLSEGTKETVSLAFRLAVLDHLFPNGGGLIVFDDPFTDMDAERTAQGCALLKECAKRHQVIFLTCHEEYTEMLGGQLIEV